MRVNPTTIISNWHHRAEGIQQSALDFYTEVERHLNQQQITGLKTERVGWSEGGAFSARREYLQVRRGEYVFHVCAAPFGSGFFVSWWLGTKKGFITGLLMDLPGIGWLMRNVLSPLTYYEIDTALMFQSVTAGCVSTALNGLLEAKGMRALSPDETRPRMRDLFANIQ